MKKYGFLFASVMAIGLVAACGSEEVTTEENATEEVAKEEAGIKVDDAYTWLKDSGLVTGEAEDVTSKFEGSEGLVKAIRTPEADIMQYEKAEQAEGYENPDLNSYAVENIYVLLKSNQDKADQYVSVLENKAPLTEDEAAAVENHPFADSMNADFNDYTTAFYGVPKDERSMVYDTYVKGKEVTWTGTVADTEAMSDSLVLVSSDDYSGQDWATISSDNKELMPYTIVVELKDEKSKAGIKNGDQVKVKGVVGSRGDVDSQFNWKLYEGEIIK